MPETSFPPFPDPAASEAYSWIVKEVKRQPGAGEAVYAYDVSTGDTVAQWYDARAGADLTSNLEEALRAGGQIVLHHNHPSNGSFIQLDLQSLVGRNDHYRDLPGLAAMWAHGNDGPHYRIALTEPAHAASVVAADLYLVARKSALSDSAGGHEIFASGWRHLVCLCLERKGYVTYNYDLSGLPNYDGPTQRLDWVGKSLTMREAFPVACSLIIERCGANF